MINHKLIVVLMLQLLTASCLPGSPRAASETPTIIPPTTPGFVSTAHQSLSAPDALSPKILNSSTIDLPPHTVLPQSAISHLPMPDVSWVFAGDNFVYWTEYQRHDQIFRSSLEGGATETVIRSLYENGDVSLIRPKLSGNWLIFVDAQASAENVPFLLRAVNLADGSEQTLIDSRSGQFGIPYFQVEGERVVWTTASVRDASCIESIVGMYELTTAQQQILEQKCIEQTGYMWVFPSISGNYIALERDFNTDNAEEAQFDVYLYDLRTNTFSTLTTDGRSSMPQISGDWIVWKNSHRFEFPKQSSIFNLRTGERHIIDIGLNGPRIADGRWVYWDLTFGSAIYVYDLETGQFYFVSGPGSGENLNILNMNGKVLTWWRDLKADDVIRDGNIEWTNMP